MIYLSCQAGYSPSHSDKLQHTHVALKGAKKTLEAVLVYTHLRSKRVSPSGASRVELYLQALAAVLNALPASWLKRETDRVCL
jgi:hypothetical protein